MSCLCSSPELEAFKFTLTGSYRFIPVRSNLATRQAQVFSAPKPDAVPTRADFVDRRVQQETRSPPADALVGEPFSLSIQAQLSCVDVQAQNQAFVHFAVASSAAEFAIAL